MKRYVCTICGYIYDELLGSGENGLAPNTKWEEVPEVWVCPLCGAAKDAFQEMVGAAPANMPAQAHQPPQAHGQSTSMQELSPLEISALCSNLARGCEKQYKPEESALFTELAVYFKKVEPPAEEQDTKKLLALLETDLAQGLPAANTAAAAAKDRGALRALVWNEKVTRILKSLLTRWEQEGDAMLQNTGVYVCTICGFVYVGNSLPELCPVCKVPNWKFEKIEGRAS